MFSSINTTIKLTVGTLLLVGAFGGGVAVGEAIFGVSEENEGGGSVTPLVWSETALRPGDWLRPSVPGLATGYENDSTSNDTTLIIVNDTLVTDTVYQTLGDFEVAMEYESNVPDITLQGRLQSRAYDFLILPIINNNPAIRVTSDYCRAQVQDPQDGTFFDLKYPVPKDKNRIGPKFALGASSVFDKLKPYASLGVWYQRKGLRVSGGYKYHRNEMFRGWSSEVSYQPTIISF